MHSSIVLVISWLIVVCVSLLWNLNRAADEQKQLAVYSAKSFYNQILLARAWNAKHGGVYVPVTEETPPNPYLDNPRRDQTTVQGLALTLVNPAYMVRQISELAAARGGPGIHITSLRPIRPENKPSDWERTFLEAFDKGASERFEFEDTKAGPILRYMAPLRTESGCLPCHAIQGYSEGDIRGGLSIVLPLPPPSSRWHLLLSHLLAGLIGMIGIAISTRLLEGRNRTLQAANAQLLAEVACRKASEERLLRFEQIVAASQDHMAFIDTSLIYRAVNNTYLAAHEKALDDIVDHSVSELLGQEIFELTVRERLNQCLGGERVSYREWFDFSGLGRRFMEVNYYPYFDAEGTVGGIVVNSRDITEAKRQEDALQQAKEEWEQTFDAISDFVSVHGPEHNLIKVNKALASHSGYLPEELYGRHCYEVVHGTSGPIPNCPHLKALATKQTITVEVEDPKLGELLVTVSPIFDTNGEAKATVHIARSIASLRAAEKERLVLKEQLVQAQKMESIGRLAGGVAHDFNNLLTIIIGYAELAVTTLPAELPEAKALVQIVEAGKRAAELTRQLLAFSRKQVLDLHLVNLDSTVENTAKMLKRLIGEDIELVIHTAATGTMLSADPTQIGQVLMNLAVNARDAMPEGGTLTITTTEIDLDRADLPVEPPLQPGCFALLSVTDSGSGMSEEVIGHIFEPFYTTKEFGKGTGLGLSIVYGIVLQHNGFLKVTSQLGKGSTFQVYLPVIAEARLDPAAGKIELPPGGDETVLMVEDDLHTRKVLEALLTSLGYQVLVAADAREAKEVSHTFPGTIHLLLTDIVLPDQRGPQLAAVIQAQRPTIKVALCSGYPDVSIAATDSLTPGFRFFQKPITLRVLAAGVREILSP